MYKVYLIKRDNVPCYVGMTKMTLKRRFCSHCTDKNALMYEPIQRIGKEHFDITPIDHSYSKEKAFLKEEFWTVFYKEQGFELYNKQIGFHSVISEESRKRRSEALKGKYVGENNPRWGKHLSDEHRKKLSDAQKKYPVQCIETKTIYTSLNEAQRQTKIDRSSISKVCNGKNKTAGGFHWKFVNAA